MRWSSRLRSRCALMRNLIVVLLTVGAASAQDQGPAVHTGPNPDKTPGLPEAVHAACPSPPPSSIQDVKPSAASLTPPVAQ